LFFLNSDNGVVIQLNTTSQIDPTRPGVIIANKQVNVTGVFGEQIIQTVNADSVITYTDYDSVQLRVSCSNVENYWMGTKFLYYFILVRNRNFDSASKLVPVFKNLMSIGINNFENLVPLFNSPLCFN
jgi:hypothetical protein